MTQIRRSPRARARRRADMQAAAQLANKSDVVGHDACQALLMKHDLRSLASLDQQVVSRLFLVWLSSTSIWLGSRVL
jgi:hypothetical protein